MALAVPSSGGVLIRTRRIGDPPPLEELDRRRAAGCLPYPAKLSYRLVLVGAESPQRADNDSPHRTIHSATQPLMSPRDLQRAEETRQANARDMRRYAMHRALLRSRHVPLAPFVTGMEHPLNGVGQLPTAEELAVMRARCAHLPHRGDYVMCRGFEPPHTLFQHRVGGDGARLFEPPLRLEQMYVRDVVPPTRAPLLTLNYRSASSPVNTYI